MFTNTLLSRIARQLTLRRAELTAHAASAVAVALTVLLVGANWWNEAVPGSRWLIATIGLDVWALLTPLGVAGVYAALRRLDRHLPGVAGAGWALAALPVFDAVHNLVLVAGHGLPTFRPLAFGTVVGALVGVVAICALRPSPSTLREVAAAAPRPPTPNRRTVGTLVVIGMVLLTGLGPIADFSATQRAAAAGGDLVWANAGAGNVAGVAAGNGNVYMAEQDNDEVLIYDTDDGSPNGSFVLPSHPREIGYSEAASLSIVGHYDGSQEAVSGYSDDGTQEWKRTIDRLSDVVTVNGTAYLATNNPGVYAVNASDGTTEWSDTSITSNANGIGFDPVDKEIWAAEGSTIHIYD